MITTAYARETIVFVAYGMDRARLDSFVEALP